MYKFANKVVE